MTGIVLPDKLSAPTPQAESFTPAFITPITPCEKAWADLCDQKRNRDVERIVAATGGWDEWVKHPISYRAFTAAFNGDTSLLLASREGVHG